MPEQNDHIQFDCPVDLVASANGDKIPTFAMTAYTGGTLQVASFFRPVVVDLGGMKVKTPLPILRNHDADQIIGHAENVEVTQKNVKLKGTISGAGQAAREVVESGKKGFPWKASIGAKVTAVEFVREGETVTVNGQNFIGPLNVARKTILAEVSFVPIAADDETHTTISAIHRKGVAKMPDTPNNQNQNQNQITANNTAVVTLDPQEEANRIREIKILCKGDPDLMAEAIEAGWSESMTRRVILERVQNSRASCDGISNIQASHQSLNGEVLEAAMDMTLGTPNLEKHNSEHALNAADQHFKGGLGLQELAIEAARMNGYQGRGSFRSNAKEILAYACPSIQAGFSTMSLPGLLSNVANKHLLEIFNTVESIWRRISRSKSVNDLKENTSYRLTADLQYEEVGSGGELKHSSLGEENFTNKAKTYGKILSITRTNWINDDLSAFADVLRMLAVGGAQKLNSIFWAEFMDNADFFKTANNNYLAGADTALGIDGLTAAEVLFLKQTQPKSQEPLGILPKLLLVPLEIRATGQRLYSSMEIRDPSAKTPIANIHEGKFEVLTSSYLSNSNYTGNSTKAWHLLAEPTELPVIEVVFLNGKESPTVESADANFNTLGIDFRGYHDFGVSKQDYRGGVKMKGEA